jgi:integrase
MPKRRKRRGPRGQGYVTFDKSRGKWRASLPLGAGRSVSRYFSDADSAKAWKEEQLRIRDAPAPPAPDERQQTVTDAISDLIEERDYLRASSERLYTFLGRHITASIGSKAVADVTPQDIAKMDRSNRTEKELSKGTAEAILNLLDTLYRKLLALRVVSFNPVNAYRTITPAKARGGKPAREPVALDPGVCRLILKQMDDDPFQPVIAWLMITGLRIGELRGLRVVNLRNGIASIVEQTDGAPLKTQASERQVPIPVGLLALTPIPSDGLLFPNADGAQLNRATIANHLNKACDKLKVPRIHLHDLRHTAATGMVNLGMSEHFEAALLGHTPSSMTRRYARPKAEALRPWLEEWAGLVLGEARLRQTGT